MPPKKKGGRSNKKKKGRGLSGEDRADKATLPASTGGVSNHVTPTPLKHEDIPTKAEWDDFGSGAQRPPMNQPFQTVYERYKQATQRFKDAIFQMTPSSSTGKNNKTIADLVDAVDFVAQHESKVDAQIMIDLRLAIRVRKRVSDSVYGGGDVGHSHFISALNYCYSILRKLEVVKKKQKKVAPISGAANKNDLPIENRFAALGLDEDGEEDETDLPTMYIPRPKAATKQVERLSLQDLMDGSERMDVIIFLTTLDELMEHTARHYSQLKLTWSRTRQNDDPPSSIIEILMEASVTTNMAINQVTAMEERLKADYPWMTTIYRLLSALVLPEFVADLTKNVSGASPIASRFKEVDAIAYLGDCLECGFRNPSDPYNQSATLASDFCKKWKIPIDVGEQSLAQAKQLVRLEVPLKQELGPNAQIMQMAASLGVKQHSWLPKSKFIGQDRYIIHTVRLLQGLSSVIEGRNGRIMSKPGVFGRQWDEGKKKATKIQHDMDDFLMADVLPMLINMCHDGLLSSSLPYEQEILPMLVSLRSFVKNPEQPISWTLAFSVHALLTSVFEFQGSNDMHSLANAAEQTFGIYMDQLDSIAKSSAGQSRPLEWQFNLHRMQVLRYLPLAPNNENFSSLQRLRCAWNPLCAGTFLSYLAFFANLDGGTAMVDSFGQLRMVLHLFNAFKKVGAIVPGQLEVLEWLNKTFANTKAIWEGEVPVQGGLTMRWLITSGVSISEAQEMTKAIKLKVANPSAPATLHSETTSRDLSPIQPEVLAKSFRRICRRDFTDVVDKYHTEQQKRNTRSSDIYHHTVRVNDTLDAMEVDSRLLATNLTSLGELLNEFTTKLFQVIELEPLIKKMICETRDKLRMSDRRADASRSSWEASDDAKLEREAMAQLFAERILGAIDFNPMAAKEMVCPRSAAFMHVFFTQISLEQFMFFSPI